MINPTEVRVHQMEQVRLVGDADRYGWLRSNPNRDRRPAVFAAIRHAMGALLARSGAAIANRSARPEIAVDGNTR